MSSRNIIDVSINNVSLPEAGINALIAGYYDIPVVFVSGERALCNQAKVLFGEVKTVAVNVILILLIWVLHCAKHEGCNNSCFSEIYKMPQRGNSNIA